MESFSPRPEADSEPLKESQSNGSCRGDARGPGRDRFSRLTYWWSCFTNLVGRHAWVLALLPITKLSKDIVTREVFKTVLAAVEIGRRSQWTVLRFEQSQEVLHAQPALVHAEPGRACFCVRVLATALVGRAAHGALQRSCHHPLRRGGKMDSLAASVWDDCVMCVCVCACVCFSTRSRTCFARCGRGSTSSTRRFSGCPVCFVGR